MGHERNTPKKPDRKPKKRAKKRKGVPPHLQRQQERGGTHREIQDHLDDIARRQK